jgi:hypothetical protein
VAVTLTSDEVRQAVERLLHERPDADRVAYALWHGFSFLHDSAFGGGSPDAVADWLKARGFDVMVDEEITGDGYWHVAAFRRDRLEPTSLLELNRELSDLAGRYGGTYDGWDGMRDGLGRWSDQLEDYR